MARFSKTRGGASFTAPGRGRREVRQGGWRMTRDPANGRRPLFLVGLSRCEVSVCRRERRPIWQKGVEVHGRSCPVCVKIPTLTAFVCRRPQSILETHIATTPNDRRPAAVLRSGCAQAEAMLSIGSGVDSLCDADTDQEAVPRTELLCRRPLSMLPGANVE